jgi:hypothetical protein
MLGVGVVWLPSGRLVEWILTIYDVWKILSPTKLAASFYHFG